MNRLLLLPVVLFVVTGCDQPHDKRGLIGVWLPDKEMTLGEMHLTSSEVDRKRYAALEDMLGNMAYVFSEAGTTFTPLDTIDQQYQWFNWELVQKNEGAFAVDVDVYGNSKRVEFLKKGGCIGVQVEVSDFIEYFCKKS